MQVSNIIKGWKNYLSKDEEVEKIAEKRALLCVNCTQLKKSRIFAWVKDEIKEVSGTVCGKCDCPIAMKVRSINEKCPLNKW